MKILKNFFIGLSFLTNVFCVSFLWMLLKIGDEKYKIEQSKEYYLKSLKCIKLESVADSISYASQLGRLDTITLVFAIFGIVLGFAAIFGFLHIKESSENIAKNTAEKWLEDNGEKSLVNFVNKTTAGGFLSEKLNPIKEAKKEAKKDVKLAKSEDEKYEDL